MENIPLYDLACVQIRNGNIDFLTSFTSRHKLQVLFLPFRGNSRKILSTYLNFTS